MSAPRAWVLVAALGLAACSQDAIGVAPPSGSDYGRAALGAAIERFVAGGRTLDGFATLVADVRALRPRMDEVVAEEAERRLLTLALEPASRDSLDPAAAPKFARALWSFALGRTLTAKDLDGTADRRPDPMLPTPSESDVAYLLRLCDGPLAVECRNTIPEAHPALVRAAATRRVVERLRNVVAACYPCRGEPEWAAAVERWEAIDRSAQARIRGLAKATAPSNWPAAGPAATERAVEREARMDLNGDLFIDGVMVPPAEQGAAMARGGVTLVGLQVAPVAPWSLVSAVVAAGRAAGVRVLLDARVDAYPWPMRRYDVSDVRLPASAASQPVQVVLRDLDARRAPAQP